jgi:hypothetical protein
MKIIIILFRFIFIIMKAAAQYSLALVPGDELWVTGSTFCCLCNPR